MRKCVVFYAGMVYGEYDDWPGSHTLPDGAYIYDSEETGEGHTWFSVRSAGAEPIEIEDVPKDLRTTLLLLS